MKNKRNLIYTLVFALVVVSGLVFANRKIKNGAEPSPRTLTAAERKARALEDKRKWDASPDGLRYKAWEMSSEGKDVRASYDKISKSINGFASMEATVTSVTFKREGQKAGPKWLIVSIGGETYMMQFVPEDFKKLSSLKVNDKIILKSRSAGYSPNHPYLIVSGDYIEHDGKVLFKRDFNKNQGC